MQQILVFVKSKCPGSYPKFDRQIANEIGFFQLFHPTESTRLRAETAIGRMHIWPKLQRSIRAQISKNGTLR
jgi:hypothetical protein